MTKETVKAHKMYPVLDKAITYIAVACVLLLVWNIYLNSNKPAYRFYVKEAIATEQSYCAGDIVKWKSKVEVLQRPIVLKRVQTVYSEDAGRTVAPELSPIYFNWDENVANSISAEVTYKIPLTLAPGNYRIINSLSSDTSKPAMYFVKLVVKPC